MTPPEMGMSPLVGLLQSIKILMAVSLVYPLKHALKICYERFEVRRRWRRNHEKSDLKKVHGIIFFLPEATAVKTIP